MPPVEDTFPEQSLSAQHLQPPLVITRIFKAERSRIWRALTTPEAVLKWHGPPFYPAIQFDADIRVGGYWRACLSSGQPGAPLLWQSGRYLVVEPPERLEYTFEWETPGHEDGPGVVTTVRIRLEELASGDTRMTFSQAGLLSSKTAKSHSAGWNGTFDRLEQELSTNGTSPINMNESFK